MTTPVDLPLEECSTSSSSPDESLSSESESGKSLVRDPGELAEEDGDGTYAKGLFMSF